MSHLQYNFRVQNFVDYFTKQVFRESIRGSYFDISLKGSGSHLLHRSHRVLLSIICSPAMKSELLETHLGEECIIIFPDFDDVVVKNFTQLINLGQSNVTEEPLELLSLLIALGVDISGLLGNTLRAVVTQESDTCEFTQNDGLSLLCAPSQDINFANASQNNDQSSNNNTLRISDNTHTQSQPKHAILSPCLADSNKVSHVISHDSSSVSGAGQQSERQMNTMSQDNNSANAAHNNQYRLSQATTHANSDYKVQQSECQTQSAQIANAAATNSRSALPFSLSIVGQQSENMSDSYFTREPQQSERQIQSSSVANEAATNSLASPFSLSVVNQSGSSPFSQSANCSTRVNQSISSNHNVSQLPSNSSFRQAIRKTTSVPSYDILAMTENAYRTNHVENDQQQSTFIGQTRYSGGDGGGGRESRVGGGSSIGSSIGGGGCSYGSSGRDWHRNSGGSNGCSGGALSIDIETRSTAASSTNSSGASVADSGIISSDESVASDLSSTTGGDARSCRSTVGGVSGSNNRLSSLKRVSQQPGSQFPAITSEINVVDKNLQPIKQNTVSVKASPTTIEGKQNKDSSKERALNSNITVEKGEKSGAKSESVSRALFGAKPDAKLGDKREAIGLQLGNKGETSKVGDQREARKFFDKQDEEETDTFSSEPESDDETIVSSTDPTSERKSPQSLESSFSDQSFSSVVSLRRVLTATCKKCKLTFISHTALSEHRERMHPGEKPDAMQSNSRSNAKRVHSVEKRNALQTSTACSTAVTNPTDAHTGQKPVTRSDEKRYACRFCVMRYRFQSSLRVHENCEHLRIDAKRTQIQKRILARNRSNKILRTKEILSKMSKKFTDAIRSGSRKSGKGKKRKNRCGKCSACNVPDCRKCSNCNDMTRYGGPGKKKQACSSRRKCSALRETVVKNVLSKRKPNKQR